MINPIPRLRLERKALNRFPGFVFWKLLGGRKTLPNKIIHIVDGSDWVINRVGGYINIGVVSRGLRCELDTSPRFYFNSIIHFGSIHTFANGGFCADNISNKLIVTIFHGNRNINSQMSSGIDKLLAYKNKLSRIVVSNSIMKERLISWGVKEEKLALIPIGVDITCFRPTTVERRERLRNDLGIPGDAVCIGSFQKDGNGWSEGLEPKLIKGPDIFVEAVTRLSKKYKIHCLLTGPARGYVKKRLEAEGVPYTHHFLKNYFEIVDFYNCTDICLVTSREEGGPKALMESMATGVPLISTRMGMAPDIIKNGENGCMVEVDDIKGIVRCADVILADIEARNRMINNGLQTVEKYDWDVIAGQYTKLYMEVIKDNEN